MKVQFDKIDDLNATLELELEKSDYHEDYLNELKNYRSKAQLKGFRKGKTPISFIEKMYGKSVLAEQINKKLQDSLYNYLKDEEIDILGDPLPNANQEKIDFDTKDLRNYKFKFDLGLSPKLDVKGLGEEVEYKKHLVDVSDSMIDEEIEAYTKKFGESKETEEVIELQDLVKFEAEEKGSSGVLNNGWATDFIVAVSDVNEEIQNQLLKSKKGDSLEFNIFSLEKDKDEEYVKKYLLKLPEEESERKIGNVFQGNIVEVKRLFPALLDQEFFDKAFGKDVIKTEEELRQKLKENIEEFYAKQSKSLMYRHIMQNLSESNHIDLPQDFLKRWLKETNEGMEDEKIEGEFPSFADNLKWTLIKSNLCKDYGIEVLPDEIKQHMTNQVSSYFAGYGGNIDPSYMNEMVTRMIQDRNQVQNAYNEIEADKLFGAIEEKVKIKENKVSLDEFKKLVDEANELYKQKN